VAPAIWDRWNGMSAPDQAANFIDYDSRTIGLFESIDDDTLASLQVDVGFLPMPIDVDTVASLRLSEHALHSWDVNVAIDPSAVLPDYAWPPLLRLLPMLAGFFAKPIGKAATVVLETIDRSGVFTLTLGDDSAQFTEGDGATANRVTLPGEALMRLTAGRLGPDHTPATVKVDGDVSLDDLRRAFPGY
jgi:hypothetical protein